MKHRDFLKGVSSRFLLTFQLFTKNELANHAAAGAYGFFLSAAPAILLVVLLLSNLFRSSPAALTDFFESFSQSYFGGLGSLIDSRSMAYSFVGSSGMGLSGLIAILNLIWTGRVFALSLQRGLRVIYPNPPGSVKPIRDNLVPFAIEMAAICYALLFIISTRGALLLVEGSSLNRLFPLLLPLLRIVSYFLPFFGLGLLTYGAYRLVPHEPPSRIAALQGALFGIMLYSVVSYIFQNLVNPSRYNLVYGALGNVVLILANVYFFFSFFFLGAQFAYVVNSFDALIFTRFRKLYPLPSDSAQTNIRHFEKQIFGKPAQEIKKYIRSYESDYCLFNTGDPEDSVIYVLSGTVGIYIEDNQSNTPQKIAELSEGNFIGEISYLLSEPRTATVITETPTVVLELPPELFEKVLQTDPETARYIIDSLSRRIKYANEKIKAL